MTRLPGTGGALFPGQFLASEAFREAGTADTATVDRNRRRLTAWWNGAAAACGPASGLRLLFDAVAMPLAGLLGFRARDAVFERRRATARLDTRAGASIALLLVPWADRPPTAWVDAAAAARDRGADWCLRVAPPHLSLVRVQGGACRQAADFVLPEALDPRTVAIFLTLLQARSFDGPGAPLIERLVLLGRRFEDRVRRDLQCGVLTTLDDLAGTIGTDHRAAPVRAAGPAAPFDEALTIVYRILFLLFAESRDLVPRHHPVYGGTYTIGTLCREALAGATAGLWEALAAVTRLSRVGCRADDLIVRPFNGRLFAREAAPSLEMRPRRVRAGASSLRDDALGRSLVAIGTRPGEGGRETVNYADLGVEQLGAVYERVLDLERGRRKRTGTYYTPQALAEFVVRRTLAPLVQGASTTRILSLRVVDPSMGSGAFLVAACRYLADAYERALINEGGCSAADLNEEARAGIRRLIAERCLAGVDANPVAVQLARLSLWLTSLARGKPLGFLDHRLRVGDSLLGASPDDLARIPDRHRRMRDRPLPLFDPPALERALRSAGRPLRSLSERPDDTVGDVRAKERTWRDLSGRGSPLEPWRLAASLWCARWFWPENAGALPSPMELRAAIDHALGRGSTLPASEAVRLSGAARSVAADRRLFHWPLEFADMFYDEDGRPRAAPGFDAVIGNPPWEVVGQDERATLRFVRESGLYPSCGRGHLNLYQPFVDRALSLARPGGRVGLIVPWGLAADEGAAALRARLFNGTTMDTLVGLQNGAGLFPIHRGLRFLVVTTTAGGETTDVRARFGVRTAAELDDLPERDEGAEGGRYPVRLDPALVRRVGGPALRIPDVRVADDLAWLDALAARHPPLGAADGWHARFGRELNATDDRACFGHVGLPVLDGRHIGPFTVNPAASSRRIHPDEARRRLPSAPFDRPRLAYRDVSAPTNRTTLIAAVLPPGVVTTHTLFCLRTSAPVERQHYLCAVFNSYVLNAVVRMLMGGHLTTGLIEGLPVPLWRGTKTDARIAALALALSSAAGEAEHAELQACVAIRYGLSRTEFERVLEGFPLVPDDARRRAMEAFDAID